MTAGAAKRIWAESRASNGSLLVLLAIADECGKEGMAEMKVAELARKCRLSERAVQNAVRELVSLGELSVTPGPGRGNRNRYSPCTVKGADSAPFEPNPAESAPFTETPQNLHPAESAPFTARPPRSAPKGAESAPFEIPDALKGSVVSGNRSKPRRASATPDKSRPEVDRLCEHLASRIEANGSKRPNIGKRWRDAARLLIDNDGRTEEQVHIAIDWCQQDAFWHRRILSMEKLREKYDQLRLDAKAERDKKTRPSQNHHQPTPEDLNALRENWARPLDGQEAGIDTRRNGQPHRVRGHLLPAAENQPPDDGGMVRDHRAP